MKTTLASILVFTALILGFVVKKPAPTPTPEVAVAAEPAPKAAAFSSAPEFDRPTTIAPKVAAQPAETPVAELSAEQVQTETEALQDFVKREDAIARLNADTVSPEERAAFGKVFERLLALRTRTLRLNVAKVQAALEAAKAGHEARVAEFVGSRS